LADLADWSAPAVPAEPTSQPEPSKAAPESVPPLNLTGNGKALELHYNIQLILPESRDQAVYDALFSSLRKHLV